MHGTSPRRPRTAGADSGSSSRRSFASLDSRRRGFTLNEVKTLQTLDGPESESVIDGGNNSRETRFMMKNGSRHHAYDTRAPYPLCFDRTVLQLEGLDRLVQPVSFVDFKDDRPRRILDIGCGAGSWCVEAAREFLDAKVVGFDMVNVQPGPPSIPKEVRTRVQWVYGNFLTTKLPFEEDEFDYVHVARIAHGVPESKWGPLFEEIHRVLRPGGVMELIEDDIIFPTLPRYFTAPLRQQSRRHDPYNPRHVPRHDHVLLESLYNSIFENRFINTRPTAILPSYVDTYFRHVKTGPVVNYPMPPLAPLQPLPPQVRSALADIMLDPRHSTLPCSETVITRPASHSFSSTISSATTVSTASTAFSGNDLMKTTTSTSATSTHFDDSLDEPTTPQPSQASQYFTPGIKEMPDEMPVERVYCTSLSPSARPDATFEQLDHKALGMHLYRAFQGVLAAREAMYEELKDRIRNNEKKLKALGWDDDDDLNEFAGRVKFERFCERYRSDMQARVALWSHLTSRGCALPPREALSRSEFVEEERVYKAMLEAPNFQTEEDKHAICRSSRVLIGYKSTQAETDHSLPNTH